MRAFKREGIPFRATLHPGGAAVFEPTTLPQQEQNALDEWRSERGQG
jgi:hypothetical protein